MLALHDSSRAIQADGRSRTFTFRYDPCACQYYLVNIRSSLSPVLCLLHLVLISKTLVAYKLPCHFLVSLLNSATALSKSRWLRQQDRGRQCLPSTTFNNDFAHIQDPNERRRLALAEIDKAPVSLNILFVHTISDGFTSFGWYHVRAIVVAGIGFFTDAYDIFAINLRY